MYFPKADPSRPALSLGSDIRTSRSQEAVLYNTIEGS